MTFENDLNILASSGNAVPSQRMLMRHWRSRSTVGVDTEPKWRGIGQPRELFAALYPSDASRGSRPTVVSQLRSTYDIDQMVQETAVFVKGWPEPGRAIVIVVENLELWPIYPCTVPLRSPRLEGLDL